MKKYFGIKDIDSRYIGLLILAVIITLFIMIYRLSTLVHGVSAGEAMVATTPIGWHGIYRQPLYLPLGFIRSVVFFIFNHHGQALTRLPNVFFGFLTVLSFGLIIKAWHGTKTAILASSLFLSSAWVLHASRLASYDVLYLWVMPTMLLIRIGLRRLPNRPLIAYGSILVWGLMLYIPGVIWLILVNLVWQRQAIVGSWLHFSRWWQRLLYVMAGLVWLPLLIIDLTRPGNLANWLGFPSHFAQPLTMLKQFGGVFIHLFIRGPQYPQLWLGRAPILDIFTLATCLIGIYFYVSHWRSARSRWLGVFLAIGVILIGLGGSVSLSLLVPLLYLAAATGIAFLLHEWLQVFPYNPLARGLGVALIVAAISLSCLYNLRAYFVAWPNNAATQIVFRYHL